MAVALAPDRWEFTPTAPSPYLLPPVRRSRRHGVLWARRVRALLIVAGLVLAVRAVPGGHGSAPLSAPEPVRARAAATAAAPSAAAIHIVQPGETLWSIARHLQPEGEVRPLVDRLAAMRHGRQLRVGERIDLTALTR